MERLLLAAVVVAVAAVVAVLVQRRRPEPPTQARWPIPTQLDRNDFDEPATPWLVAVFTSATCSACERVLMGAQPLASDQVAVTEVEVKARPDVHKRYQIEAVPLVVVADADGVVRASAVGPTTPTELWDAVAEARRTATTEEEA
jgi:hypothetical protein